MFKRVMAFFILFCFFIAPASAESLSHFMFLTTLSMSIHEGEASILVLPSAKRVNENRYSMKLELRERGGVNASIDSIYIHLFDDDFNSEDEVYESSIEIAEVNGTVKAEETIEAKIHQWVGYEVVSKDKHFYGIVQCGDWMGSEDAQQEEEQSKIEEKQSEEAEDL